MIPLVSQKAVRRVAAAALRWRLVFIALRLQSLSKKLRRNPRCGKLPERIVNYSFAETRLSLCGKRLQIIILGIPPTSVGGSLRSAYVSTGVRFRGSSLARSSRREERARDERRANQRERGAASPRRLNLNFPQLKLGVFLLPALKSHFLIAPQACLTSSA